jgi:hypothetical protein
METTSSHIKSPQITTDRHSEVIADAFLVRGFCARSAPAPELLLLLLLLLLVGTVILLHIGKSQIS